MNEFLKLLGNPYFWVLVGAWWVFSAFVSALDTPTEKDGRAYRMLFKFSHSLAGSIYRAFGRKIPGANGNGGAPPAP